MGDLLLHPTHPLFKQLARPTCPECQREIFPMTPIEIEELPDGKQMYRHKECADDEPSMAV